MVPSVYVSAVVSNTHAAALYINSKLEHDVPVRYRVRGRVGYLEACVVYVAACVINAALINTHITHNSRSSGRSPPPSLYVGVISRNHPACQLSLTRFFLAAIYKVSRIPPHLEVHHGSYVSYHHWLFCVLADHW